MPAEPVYKFCHRDLLPDNGFCTGESKPETTHIGKEFGYKRASYLRRVPTVAVYTLATLAAQELTHQVLATPAVGIADQPQTKEAGDLVIPDLTEEPATKETKLERDRSSIASPESLVGQEFAPESSRASELPIAQPAQDAQKALVPTLASSAPLASRTGIAPPETEVMLARTSTEPERSIPVLDSPAALKERSQPMLDSPAPQPESATMLSGVQSRGVPNLQEVPPPAQSATRISNSYAPTSQATVNSQQTGELVAQAVPNKSCLAYAPAAQGSANLQQTSAVVAQRQPTESCREVESLREQLRELENLKVEGGFQSSPALSIYIPTAFGADDNTVFITGTYQQRTRYGNVDDGGLGIGIGLGDARRAVGVELSYTAASFGGSRDFGAGGFNAKVHRQLGNGWAVAAGWNGFLNVGGDNDFENSPYGVVSKVIQTRDDINLPFSRVAVTAGVGGGQFRTEDAVANDSGGIGVFGNVAVRVARPVSLIAEWSGQDLGVGVSVAPFKNIPLVITPAVRDLAGAGDGPRFVLSTGFAYKF